MAWARLRIAQRLTDKRTVTLFLAILSLALLAVWIRDRNWRRRAERLLAEAREQNFWRERKMQTILDNAPIVFSAVDAQGIFRISEGKGLEKLGRKANQSVGISIFEMHNQNPIIIDAVNRAFRGERIATSFVLSGITYDLFIGPEKNAAGEVVGASMLSVDISDRKRAEEAKNELLVREQTALRTSKLKSEFVATMSHEIRTPISGVLGMTSLLLDTALTPQQKEYADGIQQSGAGLLTVINDILDFSKIESGKLDFESIHFNLLELIDYTLKSLHFSARQNGIAVQTELSSALPVWVKGNAIKFTEQGKVRITASLVDSPDAGGRRLVRIEVEDTGIGISREGLRKLFVAFSQAEASMSRRFGGTGLGLSISKELVERMGGHIGVTSEEGRGSTFWFVLPFGLGEVLVEENVSRPGLHSPASASRTPLILVAEDNQVNQVIAVRMLEKMGCRSQLVADGVAALESLEAFDYDLVLMDCQMPRLDGLEATRRFRARATGRNQGLPILAMTANAMKGDRESCLAAGMDDYIVKPISYGELSTVISRWLEIRRRRRLAA